MSAKDVTDIVDKAGWTVSYETVIVAVLAIVMLCWILFTQVFPALEKRFRKKYERDSFEQHATEEHNDFSKLILEHTARLDKHEIRILEIEKAQQIQASQVNTILEAQRLTLKTLLEMQHGLDHEGIENPGAQEITEFLTTHFGK